MTEPAVGANRPHLQETPADPVRDLRRHGFLLDPWRVEPRRNRIVSPQGERRLDPLVMEMLVHLAARAGDVITRDELIEAVWKDTFVSDNSVSQAVSRLRKALGDDTQEPRFIETVSKSGYRLVARVQSWSEPSALPEPAVIEARRSVEEAPGERRVGGKRPSLAVLLLVAALAVGLPGAWFFLGRPAPPAFAASRLIPELTLVGTQFEPVLSPSGDQIAFCWRGSEPSDWSIWVHTVGETNQVRLTRETGDERFPAWSPDGRSIAYVSYKDDGSCGIYRSLVLGGAVEHLGDCGAGIRSLNWSPDGGMIVMSLEDSDENPLRLELLDLEDGSTRILTTPPDGIIGDRAAVFSPDGSLIAFERRYNRWRHDVMVVASAGGEPTRLTNDAWGQLRGVDWRSDSAAVIFSSNRTGQFSLWQVPAGGGEPTRLPIDDTWVTQPSVSRTGGRLIYRTFRDVVDIWSLPLGQDGFAAGEPIRQVASTRSERHPSWSPTGLAIAFLSDRSGTTELWSGRPDGTGLMRHTNLAGPLPGSPGWSPDGHRLVFDAATEGHSDLWIVEGDTRRPVRLTDESSEERNGTFSRDGRWIYFASDRSGVWQVWRMPAAGGPATAVTEEGGFLARESLDGSWLYFVKLEEPGIWRVPPAGGREEQVLTDLDLSDWGSWTVGATGIYFVSRSPTTIQFLDFAESRTRPVFTPSRQIPYLGRPLSLSEDGLSLLFSMIDHSDDEVMRVEHAGL